MRRAPEPAVINWLARYDVELALSTVALAEVAYGIQRIRPQERAARLEADLLAWRRRFADNIFAFTEPAALAYADIMGAAVRHGRPMSVPDGMIAAIALVNGGRLATRNLRDFADTGLELICPWDY